MPGDLPGVDSNEDKEVWEYVFEVGVGSLRGGVGRFGIIIAADPRDGSHWVHAKRVREAPNSEKSVCLNNNHH